MILVEKVKYKWRWAYTKMRKLLISSLIILLFGMLLLLDLPITITGAAIGLSPALPLNPLVGSLFIITSVVLFVLSVGEESKLEKDVIRLFVKDKKKGQIRFADHDYVMGRELGHPVQSESAQKVLEELKKDFGEEEEFKKILQQEFEKAGYFKAAYTQRDILQAINTKEPKTEGDYADLFLKQWDPNYHPFTPPKNPLLVYQEKPRQEKATIREIYDTREIVPIMAKNIDGFEIVEEMGNHDVTVEYKGARFQIFAGSKSPYEVPWKNIRRALHRIVEEDVKSESIKEDEQGLRLEVLEKYVFDG